MPEGSQWCATDADQDGDFKSVGECKQNCPTSKTILSEEDFNSYTFKSLCSVCRLTSNITCNVHGTVKCPTTNSYDSCICGPDYVGDLCEYSVQLSANR